MLMIKEYSANNVKIIRDGVTLVIPFEEVNVQELLRLARDIVYSKKGDYIETRKILTDAINGYGFNI